MAVQKTVLAYHIATCHPRFSDLPTSLDWLSCLARTREETKWSGLNSLLYLLCSILLQKGDPKLQNSLIAPSTLCCPQYFHIQARVSSFEHRLNRTTKIVRIVASFFNSVFLSPCFRLSKQLKSIFNKQNSEILFI